jgi:hypothetical protein
MKPMQLQAVMRALGVLGLLGIAGLLLCISFYLSGVRPAEQELSAERLAGEQLRTRTLAQPVSTGREAELRRFYGLFPPAAALADQLGMLYGMAQQNGLQVDAGDYRLEPHGQSLLWYRVTLPMHGAYPQLRAFVAATLQGIPTASLDALQFERKKIGDPALDAQVRLTLYFRPEGDTP